MDTNTERRVALFGGAGFIGRVLARQLSDAGYRVRVISRRDRIADPLSVLPGVEFFKLSTQDPKALVNALKGIDVVVNLVGILHETRQKTFQAIHVDGVRALVEACQESGISRFIHLSAVGASLDAPSRYLQSKAEAEEVLKSSPLAVTILSPSIVFGPGDQFINLFSRLLALTPVLPLACADAQFQPVYVEDVARAVVESLNRPETIGKTLALGGPDVLSFSEIIRRIERWSNQPRPIIPLPLAVSYLQAFVMELMPAPLMTRDNVRSMQVPNVAGEFPDVLGFKPQSMDLVVPTYLRRPEDSFAGYRRLASR